MTRKTVITGRGLVTPLGYGLNANLDALRSGKSGIVRMNDWEAECLDSLVAGKVNLDIECPAFERKKLRFMSPNSVMAIAAAYEAITEAGYTMESLPGSRMAVINGCAGSSYNEVCSAVHQFILNRNMRRVSAFSVPRIMPSSAVSNLSLTYGITGESYDISCACTSGAIAIITGSRLIESGAYDIVLVGGSEEVAWQQTLGFNAMKALSTKYNSEPEKASRPFDRNRDGFVIAEGAGLVILESEEHAAARGAKIRARLAGYATNSNATDMVAPDVTASANVMRLALAHAGLQPEEIDYINTHGTSTPVGDPIEMNAIKDVFGDRCRAAINSTKSMTGHAIGAAGAMEAIFSSLMLEHSFISPTLNLENPEEEFSWADLVCETRHNVAMRYALSNSFGFGGTNATLILEHPSA